MINRIKKNYNRVISRLGGSDLNFIQMRLLVKDFTPEFEKSLKEKIEYNILQANVREASEEDIDCLIYLHEVAWHSTPMPYRPLKKDSINNLLNDPSIIFLIAKVEGEDSGFALINFTGEKSSIGVIAGMGIIPEFHRKGLGTILGMAAWDYFKKKGVAELRCKVYKDNKIAYDFIKGLRFEEYDDDFIQWKLF